MRPFELLLVAANFLPFVVFVVPRFRAIRWTGYVVFIPPALVVVQIFVEGSRWQMVPTYVLTGLFLVVWGVQQAAPAGGIVKPVLVRRVIVGVMIVLCVLDLGLSAALPTVLPVFHFPPPSGPYQIGTVTYHWVDTSRHELFSPDPKARRELMAQFWYPVKGDTSVEELVSHGYIVVGLDQPYAAAVVFPDGRQILGWTRDQMQPLIQQSLSPVTPAPTVGGQALTNGIIPYFAQDVSFTLDQLTALNRAAFSGRSQPCHNCHSEVSSVSTHSSDEFAGITCKVTIRPQLSLCVTNLYGSRSLS